MIFIICSFHGLFAQTEKEENKRLSFEGDIRLRIEHDWDSMRSDGSKRNDRSRLRYRIRLGSTFKLDKYSSFSTRLRTANINNQQDPHHTIGGQDGEFELGRIGFEKIFYQYQNKGLTAWMGKNSIPLKKLNELFWNDNVFPEGIALKYKFRFQKDQLIDKLSLNAGHFIVRANGQGFRADSYLQVFQIETDLLDKRLSLFPSYYYFRDIGDLPDGFASSTLDYNIFHLGSTFTLLKKPKLVLGLEYYNNFTDYTDVPAVADDFKEENQAFVIFVKLGETKTKGDWSVKLTYAHIEKNAVVDYFAQNDWVRWNYSGVGSNASRLTNFRGFDLRISYAIKEKYILNLRAFSVEQILPFGIEKEDGNRVRLDLDVKF